jgi:hypothetical protein
MKEINFLRGRDRGAGKIDFVDISASSYAPEANAGITYEQVGCVGHSGGACTLNSEVSEVRCPPVMQDISIGNRLRILCAMKPSTGSL